MKGEKTAVFLVLACCFGTGALFAEQPSTRNRTNITVTSEDSEQRDLDKRINPEPKPPVLFSDSQASIGVTEDGDPNLRTRF